MLLLTPYNAQDSPPQRHPARNVSSAKAENPRSRGSNVGYLRETTSLESQSSERQRRG